MWPLLGLRSRSGGAWKLWTLAHWIDTSGSGVVTRAKLQERLQLDPRKFRRWLSEAEEIGLVKLENWRSGAVLILTGIERAARILGCESLGPRPMSLPVELLLGAGWRSHIWAAMLASLGREGGVMISRAKLRELTGISERSQSRFEREAGVKIKANYCVTDQASDQLSGKREFGRAHAFPWRDAASGERVIGWRLPDTRRAPGHVWRCASGRAKKINRVLRGASFLKARGRLRMPRIFWATLEKAERAAQRMGLPDQPRRWRPVDEIYGLRFRSRRASVWACVEF